MNKFNYKECRICYNSNSQLDNELISPCNCKGFQKYVHKKCLNKWRTKNRTSNQYYKCEVCLTNYNISFLSDFRTVEIIRFFYFKICKFKIKNFFYYQIIPLTISFFNFIEKNKLISDLMNINLSDFYSISFGYYITSLIYLIASLIIFGILIFTIRSNYKWKDSNSLTIIDIIILSFINILTNGLFYNFLLIKISYITNYFFTLGFNIFLNTVILKILCNFTFEFFLKNNMEILSINYNHEDNIYVPIINIERRQETNDLPNELIYPFIDI